MVWLSASEVAKLMSTASFSVRRRATKEGWQSRSRKGRGGGCEYHISSLPPIVQKQLNNHLRSTSFEPATPPPAGSFLWGQWEAASKAQRKNALRRTDAVKQVACLMSEKHTLDDALELVSSQTQISSATLERFYIRLKKHDPRDWAVLCLPKQRESSNNIEPLICDSAWDFFKSDYLRLEQPTITACYYRMQRVAKKKGWQIPSLRSMYRVIQKIPIHTRIVAREGEVALRRLYPSVERDKSGLAAMEWLNGDGYQHNVFVRFPNGKVGRPKTWFWQDVHSGKILAWRTAETESSCQIRLAFADVVEKYGIPQHITIDNTRAAANKFLTGGVSNRYRFKIKDTDPLGLFPALGITIHWTSVVPTAAGKSKGWGQAKPVERAFGIGGISEVVDKHPAFAGAYTGANTTKKPDNYQSKAVALDDFEAVLDVEIAAWNAKAGRRSSICAGRLSFDEAFNRSYAEAEVIKATEEQRRMFLLEAEAVKVRIDATVVLSAGRVQGYGQNRYHCAELYDYIGKLVTVRFDPDDLYKDIYIYKQSGEFIAIAECLVPAGFADKETARKMSRERRQMVKASKEVLKAERRMAAAEVTEELTEFTPKEPQTPAAKVVTGFFNKATPKTAAKPTMKAKDKPTPEVVPLEAEEQAKPLVDWEQYLTPKKKDDGELSESEKIYLEQADS